MIIITVTGSEGATNANVLQGTRLQTVPKNGVFALEMQAATNSTAANFITTLELPNGSVPFRDMLVPAGGEGGIDSRLAYRATFIIEQGGHAVLSFTGTGVNTVFWRVTFKGRGDSVA